MVREAVVVGLVAIVASCVSGACPAVEAAVTGPMLGAVDEHSARVWLRPGGEAEVTLTIRDPDGLPGLRLLCVGEVSGDLGADGCGGR